MAFGSSTAEVLGSRRLVRRLRREGVGDRCLAAFGGVTGLSRPPLIHAVLRPQAPRILLATWRAYRAKQRHRSRTNWRTRERRREARHGGHARGCLEYWTEHAVRFRTAPLATSCPWWGCETYPALRPPEYSQSGRPCWSADEGLGLGGGTIVAFGLAIAPAFFTAAFPCCVT